MKKSNFTFVFPAWTMLALSLSGTPAIRPGEDTQTADDQRNNKDDVALIAKIRKALMDDKTLSMMAHNVKIIAQNGVVTLRGAVRSEEERALVLAKARDIAGATVVTDLLTVSPPKANRAGA